MFTKKFLEMGKKIETIHESETDMLDSLKKTVQTASLSDTDKDYLFDFINAKKEYSKIKKIKSDDESAYLLAADRLDVFRNYFNNN
ncbi:MAG: hypothetical protein ABS911_12630 [Carnobacterium sp.]|uniref:hypothetical protein n=1 Tax=Carnobacterium sp. TaxID=48221 RepID=UPI003314930D